MINFEPAVFVDHVKTVFGTTVVHKDISFQAQTGEVTAIIAASGGGKSVLLREILALSQPQSGSIKVLGTSVTEASQSELQALRNRVGVLFQNGALFSGLSVAENIAAPLVEHTKLKKKSIDELVELRLSLVGLPQRSSDLKPSELSGGMRKRVALARALSLEPEILFLDEPTSGLDPISAREFDQLVRVLNDSLKLTVVIVTHDPETLWAISDRVIALADGVVIGDGTVKEVSKVAHPWLMEYFSNAKKGLKS